MKTIPRTIPKGATPLTAFDLDHIKIVAEKP